jgi:hypothetical protein
VASFLYFFIWYIGYYPGAFSPDSFSQYSQAITDTYNDWHPVLHTLIFFKLPILITGKMTSIIWFQIFYFSLILGYMSTIITQYFGKMQAVITLLCIILNPYIDVILLYPSKCVAFSIFGLLSTVITFQILLKKHESQKVASWILIVLGFIVAFTTLFRHNAILFTGPLLLGLLFNLKKIDWIKVFISFLVVLILIKGPLYSYLNVEQPGYRVLETVGLPMTVIGNVVKETPELMDEELSDFVYSIATPEEWENKYECGNFNSIKWTNINLDFIDNAGYYKIIKLMFKCFKLSPRASFKALFSLTDIVYGIDTGLEGDLTPEIFSNDYGVEYSGVPIIRSILEFYTFVVDNSILVYFRTCGVAILALITIMIIKMNLKSSKNRKKNLMVMPIFIYDFGTMLLLTGEDARFFFITFLLAPIEILFLMYEFYEN